jgi:hypothetical protein
MIPSCGGECKVIRADLRHTLDVLHLRVLLVWTSLKRFVKGNDLKYRQRLRSQIWKSWRLGNVVKETYITLRGIVLRKLGRGADCACGRNCSRRRFQQCWTKLHAWFAGDSAREHGNPANWYGNATDWHGGTANSPNHAGIAQHKPEYHHSWFDDSWKHDSGSYNARKHDQPERLDDIADRFAMRYSARDGEWLLEHFAQFWIFEL